MKYDSKPEKCPLYGPLFIKKARRENLLQIIQNTGSITKAFNKDTDTSCSGTPKAKLQRHQPKINSVLYNNPCDFINTRDTNNESTPLVNENDGFITGEK